jgi:DNA-directed RNA polymerase specialized sigma24 family protein
MASEGSVTRWIDTLKQGDPEASQRLWEVYFQRLVALARARLRDVSRGTMDEEDVALSAFDSFCRGAERGRFPRLNDRDDLWQLLIVITVRKASDLRRHERRECRSANRSQSLSDLAAFGADDILGNEPTPELSAQVAEECSRLLADLRDETLRSVALWKMEGYTNEEIAAKVGCVRRSVDRKIQAIRKIWSASGAAAADPRQRTNGSEGSSPS